MSGESGFARWELRKTGPGVLLPALIPLVEQGGAGATGPGRAQRVWAHLERVQPDEQEEPEAAKAEDERDQEHSEGRELLAREKRQRGVACQLVARGVVGRHQKCAARVRRAGDVWRRPVGSQARPFSRRRPRSTRAALMGHKYQSTWPYKDARWIRHQRRLPLGQLPKACNQTVPCLSTLAAGTSADSCPKSGHKSMCAGRLAAWDPEKWANPEATGTRPDVSAARLEHVCGSIMVHVARPSWRDLLDFNRSTLWESKYVMSSPGTQRSRRAAEQRRCVARLQSFRPRVCSLENVFVYGSRKRMYGDDGFYLPPQARIDPWASPQKNVSSERICNESTSVISCVGHAVLSRNAIGTARRPEDRPA